MPQDVLNEVRERVIPSQWDFPLVLLGVHLAKMDTIPITILKFLLEGRIHCRSSGPEIRIPRLILGRLCGLMEKPPNLESNKLYGYIIFWAE